MSQKLSFVLTIPNTNFYKIGHTVFKWKKEGDKYGQIYDQPIISRAIQVRCYLLQTEHNYLYFFKYCVGGYILKKKGKKNNTFYW